MNLFHQNTITFPIDSGTSSLHVNLPKDFLECQLTTPDGKWRFYYIK